MSEALRAAKGFLGYFWGSHGLPGLLCRLTRYLDVRRGMGNKIGCWICSSGRGGGPYRGGPGRLRGYLELLSAMVGPPGGAVANEPVQGIGEFAGEVSKKSTSGFLGTRSSGLGFQVRACRVRVLGLGSSG